MPRDERIDDLKDLNAQQDSLADQIDAADVAEDAAYEATIADLQTQLATAISERDALATEKATTLVELRAILDSLAARITALETP
jgi:hypothetical protein